MVYNSRFARFFSIVVLLWCACLGQAWAQGPDQGSTPKPQPAKATPGDPQGADAATGKKDKDKDKDKKDKNEDENQKDDAKACPEKDGDWGDRTLKGHTFPTLTLTNGTTAFVTTHFGIRQGAVLLLVPGMSDATAGKFDLTATGLIQNFDFGIKITDWLGFYGIGGGTVYTGANLPTLLSGDNSFTVNGEAGAVVRVARIESSGTQIALRASGGAGTGRVINILGVLSNVINSGGSIDQVFDGNIGKALLVPQSTVTFQGSVHAAQTLTKNFGLQLAVEVRQTTTTVSPYDPNTQANVAQTSGVTNLNTTLGFSVDGAPSGIPVAVIPEYQLSATLSGSGPLSHFLAIGIYYSGRRDLQLGIAGASQLGLQPQQGVDANGQPTQSGTPSLFYGQFVLRYIW